MLDRELLSKIIYLKARTAGIPISERMEGGEVEPRALTRISLSNILAFDLGKENTDHQSLWLALLHLSSAVCVVFIPLLLWSWKKDQSYSIDRQGLDVLNFQITIVLILLALTLVLIVVPSTLLMANELDRDRGMLGNVCTLLPPLPVLVLAIFTSYQVIVNTVRALSGQSIHYPLSILIIR